MGYNGTPLTNYNDNTDNFGELIGQEHSRLYNNDNFLKSIFDLTGKGLRQGRFETSGTTLTVFGVFEVFGNLINLLGGSSLSFAGASVGNHYVFLEWDSGTNTATLKRQALSPIYSAEITADTNKYSPNPLFNNLANSYLLGADPKKVIIGFVYYDSGFKTVHEYKSGKNKNDDIWESEKTLTPIDAITLNSRLQFTDNFIKSFGENISIVDLGVGTTLNDGLKITALRKMKLNFNINVGFSVGASGGIEVNIFKNNSFFKTGQRVFYNGVGFLINSNLNFYDFANMNDFYSLVISENTAPSGIKSFINELIVSGECE